MLPHVRPEELARLRMSVGYGRQQKGRPLSPVEVGLALRRARDAGATLSDCAKAIQLDGTGHIGRFLQILNLPTDLQHLVDWGASKRTIGFSAAVELSRFKDNAEQRCVANAILGEGLNKRELQQVRQLRSRSQRPISECIREVIGMRPTVTKHYVFVGSLSSPLVIGALASLRQENRDSILESGLKHLGLHSATGRLGAQFFTVVGNGEFNESMTKLGPENLEAEIRQQIHNALGYDQASC